MKTAILAVGAISAIAGGPACAQVSGSNEVLAAYAAEDFARFAPKTALDMVLQVPGFAIDEADQRRGLGQRGANVLIDGARIAAKNIEAEETLRRIPAERVERIEILDGARLNIAGLSGQVLNVITQRVELTGQFSYKADIPTYGFDPQLRNASVSVSGSGGSLSWTVSLSNDAFAEGRRGPERVYAADGTLLAERDERYAAYADRPTLAANASLERGTVDANLNAEVSAFLLDQQEVSDRRPVGGVANSAGYGFDQDKFSYEIGGDLSVPLAGGKLKLIGLHRYNETPIDTLQDVIGAESIFISSSRFSTIPKERESVLRAEYGWTAGPGEWLLSAEGALNSLDQTSAFSTATTLMNYMRVAIPGSRVNVDERRAEASATYTRPLSPKLSFQGSLGAEYSEIEQSGDARRTREFVRPKGFGSLTWKPKAGLDIAAKIEREVGQLDFQDFAADVDLRNGTIDVTNPELVPSQSWRGELEVSKSLGALGKVTVQGFGEYIEDIADRILVPGVGEAAGNIDHAWRYGTQVNLTLLGESIGAKGAKLDVDFIARRSEVEDPVTGETRFISRDLKHLLNVRFRHDIPKSDWTWGASYEDSLLADLYRISEIITFRYATGYSEVFLENKDVFGTTVRGAVGNFTDYSEKYDRIVYTGSRAGPVAFVERRDRDFGVLFRLSVEGTF